MLNKSQSTLLNRLVRKRKPFRWIPPKLPNQLLVQIINSALNQIIPSNQVENMFH